MNESNLNNVGSILETDAYDYITFDDNEMVKIEKEDWREGTIFDP